MPNFAIKTLIVSDGRLSKHPFIAVSGETTRARPSDLLSEENNQQSVGGRKKLACQLAPTYKLSWLGSCSLKKKGRALLLLGLTATKRSFQEVEEEWLVVVQQEEPVSKKGLSGKEGSNI